MDYKRAPWEKVILVVIEIALAVNIILLDVWIFGQIRNAAQPKAASTVASPNPTGQPLPTTTIASPLVASETPVPTAVPTNQTYTAPQQNPNTSGVTDYFIPLGSGTGTGTDWTNVPGLQSYVNTNSYPNIKTVVFEVSAQIPTGNQTASIQLFDATAGHPVWSSQVNLSGGNAVFLTSQPITLDPGNNLYQVQLMTQLGYPVTINQSRIHITLN